MVKLHGHADYNPGNDIVCAGISTLFYSFVNAIANIPDIIYDTAVKSGDAMITINEIPEKTRVNQSFIMLLGGLLEIESKYPKHIRIIFQNADDAERCEEEVLND